MGRLQGMDDGVVQLLQALGNAIRKTIVASLASAHSPLRFSELMQASGLNPNSDTGQFNYHLGELTRRNIIMKADNVYLLTQFGFKVAKLLDTLERESAFLLFGAGICDESAGNVDGDPPLTYKVV